jgi:hypothetical protein
MKVFVRAGELAGEKPTVVACYSDESEVSDKLHGDGMTVLTVPSGVIVTEPLPGGGMSLPRLASNWRERVGSVPVAAEAQRRISDAFSVSDQLSSLHDMIDSVMKYGADETRWPQDARQRKAAFDEKWRYVVDVKNKLRELSASPPSDPSGDKIWPRRPMKKA